MTMNETPRLLAHERIVGSERCDRWIFFIHGFLGKGQNWRSFARRLVDQKPGLGACLVDLRLHGESKPMPAPHTIEAAANDIAQLSKSFGEPVKSILGHSFGAKVALQYCAMEPPELLHAWLVDFTPWARPKNAASQTYDILSMMTSLKDEHFDSRDEFIFVLTKQGITKATAAWLAMNGKTDTHGFHLYFDAVGLRALLDDYFDVDLMPLLEKAEEKEVNIHLVLGGASSLLDEGDRERLIKLASAHPSRITTRVIKEAGHDVHMDCPDQLLQMVAMYA